MRRFPERRNAAIAMEGWGTMAKDSDALQSAFVHETATVEDNVEIGAGAKVWRYSHIFYGSRIGKNVSVGQNVAIGPNVSVGDGCRIQNNVSVYEGATLEDDVFCGPSCVFTNVLTPRAFVSRKGEFGKTLVKRGATIGANATIVCGAPDQTTTLGEYCFIAAGAVVTGDVPAYALMAGVPARRIGWVSRAGEVLRGDLTCPRTGERYELFDAQLRPVA
jgi:UDP-2-acetamido-3-amino-2,3-dideoxy-glucuronate N-acetyltransferase